MLGHKHPFCGGLFRAPPLEPFRMSIQAVIATVALVVVGLALIMSLRHLTARGLRTFRATVVGKAAERTVIYTGIFVPMAFHYVVVEGGVRVRVHKADFDSIDAGDSVMVSKYSDGSHRLERIMVAGV